MSCSGREMRSEAGTIRVEVAYADSQEQLLLSLELPADSCARDALSAAGLLDRFPQWRQSPPPLGIWGRRIDANLPLGDGDRVEVYRPLLADPKVTRRRRAARR